MASPTSAASSAPDEDSALLDWLRQRGGSCASGVRIGENSGERGLFATKDFPANAMLLFVPADLHIRAPSRDSFRVDREDDRLALDLLNKIHMKRGELRPGHTRMWAKWIASLPATYTTPLHWSDATVALLGDTELVSTIQRQRARLERRYDDLRSHISNHGYGPGPGVNSWGETLGDALLTFANYRWAYATIRSRAAYLGEEGAAQAIVPVGDLFNHSTDAPNVAAAYALPARAYVYTATQPIAAGDELLVSYGAHDNATLLKHYGFVPRGPNPHDRVAVTLDDAPATNLATGAAARAWLAEQGFDSGHALTHDGPSFELLAALRLRHATDDEYRNGAAFAIAEGEAVSDANEARVWRAVGDLARALARPPSEAEDDRRRIDALRQKPNVEAGEAHELLAREFRAARAALVEANVARAEREAREREGDGGAKRRRTEAD
jgi:hypothetical protein